MVLGLDIGTTGAKALLIGPDGTVRTSATAEYPMSTPKPLWSEQDPEDWWKATREVIQAVSRGVKPEKITGIGLTGQMHGLVLLDERGKLLRPCIMWNDQRTAAECAEITQMVGAKHLLELTANPVLPGFTAPKILWVKKHEPAVFRQVAHILLPKDYIRFKLTGVFATDVSDASGTSILDVGARSWSREMLSSLGIPKEWMPAVHESVQVTGKLTRAAASETGLAENTPVVGGAGDQAAGAIGSGIVKTGIVSLTIGTSGVVFAHTDRLAVEPEGRLHAFCHAVPGAWHLMGVTLAAGGSLRWYRDTFGAAEREKARKKGADVYDILSGEAAKAPEGSEGLLFLPYLSGERTPYPDPSARGAFIGLTVRHTQAHMVRCVMEGVAYSLRDCLELVRGMGIRVRELRVSGGGARSRLWRQIIADVCNAELVTVTSTEGAPYGAALLAGVGTGMYKDVQAAAGQTIKVATRTLPSPGAVRKYQECYSLYRKLYPTLKETFQELTTIQIQED